MGFASRMRDFVANVVGPPAGSLPWIGDRPGVVGPSTASTTPQSALALTAVYRCCSLLADAVALLPPAIYTTGDTGGRVQQRGTAAARALATISYADAEVFAFGLAATGNGFLKVIRDGTGAPASLVGIPPWRVSMQVDARRRIYYRIAADASIGEAEEVVPAADMAHATFRAIGSNRHWGVPPAATCSGALGMALRSREVQRVLFDNLSAAGGVLSAPGKVDPTVAKRIQSEWAQNFSGSGLGKVAVLSNGLTFDRVVFNAVDAQLLDQVKASVDDVSAAYGIPTNFLSSSQHLTYASSSEATKSLYVSALRPFTARCSDALARVLLSRNDRASGAFVDYDLTSVLLPPGTEMASFIATLVQAGVLSPNEARNLYLNLPDHPDGDALRASTTQPAKAPV